MQQIVDLETSPEYQSLQVPLVSIAFDPSDVLAASGTEFGVGPTPLLTDTDRSVSEAYDVLQWAVATGEPGHTFVLVDEDGKIAWIRDYGVLENSMYVDPSEIASQVRQSLSDS
jgi:peroxiredoxin